MSSGGSSNTFKMAFAALGFSSSALSMMTTRRPPSAALARAALDLGFYLSMSGIAAFPKSQELRDIFAAAPIDRILVETDSPYLAPPPHRGKRNEPAYTAHTARVGGRFRDWLRGICGPDIGKL